MRLINVDTFELEEYFGASIPEYAILSHTWGAEEVTLQEWQRDERPVRKAGFKKISRACHRAQLDGFQYLWCDTNCIDKTSSAELSEAINSMYAWYRDSKICYAHLADVPSGDNFQALIPSSRWFTRGWTLQELLAPDVLIFFCKDWTEIGNKEQLSFRISIITGIPEECLRSDNVQEASIAQRMSWVSRRQTTRVEDIAYCMLGILGLNMPLLYGEGERAFLRLQEELIRVSNDQTIFCWSWLPNVVPETWTSMLAPSPAAFRLAGSIVRSEQLGDEPSIYSMTNAGLSIRLRTISALEYVFVCLEAQWQNSWEGPYLYGSSQTQVSIPLRMSSYSGSWKRINFPPGPTPILRRWTYDEKPFIVHHSHAKGSISDITQVHVEKGFAVLLTFGEEIYLKADCRIETRGGVWDKLSSIFFLKASDVSTVAFGVFAMTLMYRNVRGSFASRDFTIKFAVVRDHDQGSYKMQVQRLKSKSISIKNRSIIKPAQMRDAWETAEDYNVRNDFGNKDYDEHVFLDHDADGDSDMPQTLWMRKRPLELSHRFGVRLWVCHMTFNDKEHKAATATYGGSSISVA